MWHRCPFKLRSGVPQSGLRDLSALDRFKTLMLADEWDFVGRGKSFVYWQEDVTVWISEGHHRANAALEIGRATGDWSCLHRLLENGKREIGSPPHGNRGLFPTRGLWGAWLLWLGW